jgi:hypothetical protein
MMAEAQWLYLERRAGRVRRVTLLDDDLRVVAIHERDESSEPFVADDCQLLRAVELAQRVGMVAAS